MALLHEANKHKKFDVRVVERNVERGVVAAKEVEDFVGSLPDDGENAEWVSIDSLAEDNSGATTH